MNYYTSEVGFHYSTEVAKVGAVIEVRQDTEFTYTFENFFHPYVGNLIDKLNKSSLSGFLDPNFHQSLDVAFFTNYYKLLADSNVKVQYTNKRIDLDDGGAYACYNWELLFHIPLTVAVHLSKNQRFAEAQRWFHYIFDPTCTDTAVPPPKRFWKFLQIGRESCRER